MLRWIRKRLGISQILENQEKIMSALDDITTETGKIETSVAAAVALINNAAGDSTQLAALTSRLAAAQASLDTAVAAHTTATSS